MRDTRAFPLTLARVALFALALLDFPATAAPAQDHAVYIQTHTNRDNGYINYRFAVAERGQELNWDLFQSKIEWDVIDTSRKPTKHIIVHQPTETSSFCANAAIHKALFAEILSRWPISEFDSISFGPLGRAPDWSWSIAVAVASSKSDDYKDYKANYPHSRITGLNGLYGDLVRQSDACRPLREFFKDFKVDIEWSGGEKIIDAKAQELPFYAQLRDFGISGKTRVIYDALGNGFTIKPHAKP